ncbi:MAG TPA: substrate-binding domain-containing protein [Burkholderiales bacterium]|nr:substrate-binding domain-containing protein [Burkholderiales bacterium]
MEIRTMAAILGAAAVFGGNAQAAELRVLASNGVKAALEELAPAFERETGHRLAFEFGVANVLKRRIDEGGAFDLAILTHANIDELSRSGKVDGASRAGIARSGVGIGVRKGAKHPDISSPEALKRTVLAAKSISWAKEGASGQYFAGLVDRMGIGEETRKKAVLAANGVEVGKLVGEGKAELAALLVNEIIAAPGMDLVGPLPAALQTYLVFDGGVASASRSAQAAKALIAFLKRPAAKAVFTAKGQEPA